MLAWDAPAEPYPPDHLPSALARACTTPRLPSPIKEPLEWTIMGWETYPHSVLPPSYVHTPEIKLQPAVSPSNWGICSVTDPPAVTFRHSGWARPRRLIRQVLWDLDTPARTLERFDTCGSDPWVVVDQSDSSRLAIHSNHCHSRWCSPCNRERAGRISGHLHAKILDGDVRFLTLTMKHSPDPLSAQIDRIYSCFRRLRRQPFWLKAVTGGAAVLEVKHSHRDNLWHVHLHALLDGSYLPQAAVKAGWYRITGDSYVVDIKPCRDPEKTASYLTKYITKSVPGTILGKPDQLAELITSFAGRRLVLTWGTWRGLALSTPLDDTVWRMIAPLPELYKRQRLGDHDAWLILHYLEKLLPEARIIACHDPPLTDSPLNDTLF